jgi:hypothetical protein
LVGIATTACAAVETGEASAAACTPGSGDEDGDDLADCDDPDCFAFEVCRQFSRLNSPDSGGNTPRSDAGGSTPAGTGGNAASGGTGGAPLQVRDAGLDAELPPVEQLPPDSGGVPDAAIVPCGGCAVGEECVEDACVPIEGTTGGTYTLSVLSGTMPLATDPGFMCVDYTCPGGGATTVWCICPPDPYVRVIRIRDGNETQVLVTDVVIEQVNPVFDGEPVVVELERGDSLRFEMWDKNETIADKQVFTCKPDLSNLEPGPLECTARSGGLGNETHVIRAELSLGPE